jgi:hypothetical protein
MSGGAKGADLDLLRPFGKTWPGSFGAGAPTIRIVAMTDETRAGNSAPARGGTAPPRSDSRSHMTGWLLARGIRVTGWLRA